MANLGEVKSAVRDILVGVPSAVESNLNGFVQRAQRELENKFVSPDQEDSFTLLCSQSSTNSGTYWIDFDDLAGESADFIRLRQQPFYLSSEDGIIWSAKPLIQLMGDDLDRQIAEIETIITGGNDVPRGAPKYYAFRGKHVFILPLPDDDGPTAGAYSTRVLFYKRLDRMTGDTNTNWFSVEAEDYLVWRAAELGLLQKRDPLFVTYREYAREEKRRLVKEYRRQIYKPNDAFVPALGNRAGSEP